MKMMNFFQSVFFLFIAGLMSVNAQVRIGADENPHDGSILDLTNSGNLGLKLPLIGLQNAEFLQVGVNGATVDDDLTAAGMVVYNTNAYALEGIGIYVWDGRKWNGISTQGKETPTIATCLPDYYAPDKTKKVTITVKNTLQGKSDDPLHAIYGDADSIKLTFLTYNLGANPNLTPKQQMAYQSAFALTNETYTDITVYGGLYQWGRSDAAHSFRCDYADLDSTNHPYSDQFTIQLYTAETLASADKFVWGRRIDNISYDWYSPHTDASTLWGNGQGLTNQTPASGTDTNNPCPSGFRVPTQHEWALLGKDDDSSTSAGSDSFSTPSGATTSTSGLVWVRVKNGVPSTYWTSDNSENSNRNYGNNNGYALYTSDTWNGIANKVRLTDLDDPEPLMFLPAAGNRSFSSGRVWDTGNYGDYWSSTVDGRAGRCLRFSSSGTVDARGGLMRVYGLSVRCISE